MKLKADELFLKAGVDEMNYEAMSLSMINLNKHAYNFLNLLRWSLEGNLLLPVIIQH